MKKLKKVSEVVEVLDVSRSTIIRKLDLDNNNDKSELFERIDGVIYITQKGFSTFTDLYGYRVIEAKILSQDASEFKEGQIEFFKNQIMFIESKNSEILADYRNRIDNKDIALLETTTKLETSEELLKKKEKEIILIKEQYLKEIHEKELNYKDLEADLEIERNKPFFQRMRDKRQRKKDLK